LVHEAGAGHGFPLVCTVNDEVCGDANDTVVQDVGADSDTGTPAKLSASAGNADKKTHQTYEGKLSDIHGPLP
jgi:hypothetical protein